MALRNQFKVTKLEEETDLLLLVKGDVLERNSDIYLRGYEHVVFNGVSKGEHLEFIRPVYMGEAYIIMDRISKSKIRIEQNRIVYSRDDWFLL